MDRVRWLVLLCLVGAVMVRQAHGTAAVPQGSPQPSEEATLTGTAKYAVGFAELAARAGRERDEDRAKLLANCDSAARSDLDRVRVAAIAGELEDADAWQQRLRELAARPGLAPDLREDVAVLARIAAGETLDAAARRQLIERHGWFGRIAATRRLPDDDAARREPRDRAVRFTVAFGAFMLLGLLALVAGMILLPVAFARWRRGKLELRYAVPEPAPRDGLWMDPLLALLALLLLLTWFGVKGWYLLGIVALAPLVPLRRVGWRAWCRGTGWHAGRGILRELGCGLLGYCVGTPVMLLGFLATVWLAGATGTSVTHPVVEEAGRGGWVAVFLATSLWAPLVEETVFRGAFYRYLRPRVSTFVAATVTGLAFAAVHPQGWVGIPTLMAIGAWLAVLRQWRGSILAPVAAHALHNTVLLLVLYWITA